MIRQVLATLSAALADNGTGLAARATAIATAAGLADIRTSYQFQKWILGGQLKQAGDPNIAVMPTNGSADLMLPQETQRDAAWLIDIAYETFDADPDIIADNVAVTMEALAEVLDRLREYSDAHGGTVMLVQEPVVYRMGQFPGAAGSSTTNGFTATATILERGTT